MVTPKKTSTVEPMEVDEPEAQKTSYKKNEMPMGSLLKDLPASSSSQASSNPGRSPHNPGKGTIHTLVAIILASVFLLLLRQSMQSLSMRDVDYV